MLTQGETLRGRYKIMSRLGQGGMGAVYEAHDNVFDTSVALKEVILDTSSAHNTQAQELAQHAFEREAKILAKVNHENIPHVKDYFTEDGSQFLVMELVDGSDLAELLQEQNKPFPVETLIGWTDRLLDALDYLHSQKPPIIHRDLKPQNLKLTTRKKIKLLDFGIAKGTESQAANTIANQTFVAATLNYSPIEQMLRVLDPTFLAVITHKYSEKIEKFLEQNADVRSDLYALGATLYHLATNVAPAEAVKRSIEIWDGKPDPLENPSKLNPSIPTEFSEFLLKSLEIKRENRFGTANEMRDALHQFAEFGTKPSLIPTVELNYSDYKTSEDVNGSDKTSAKTFVLENPSNTGGGNATVNTNPTSDVSAPIPPPISTPSEEIITEVGNQQKSSNGQESTTGQQFNQQKSSTGQQFNPQVVSLSSQGQTANQTQQPPPKKKSNLKFLLVIPVLGVLLLGVVGAAGAFYYFNYMSDGKTPPIANTNSNKGTEITKDKPTNDKPLQSDTNPIGGGDIFGDENTNTEQNTNTGTETTKTTTTKKPTKTTKKPTKTTTKTTTKKTNSTKTSGKKTGGKKTGGKKTGGKKTGGKKTGGKKPQDMNCIFTDSC